MFDKKRLFICGLCMAFLLIGIWGCNDSSTKTKVNPTVDPSIKGYPNGGLLAKQEHLFDAGVVIVDARSAEAYNAGHIPGAISMPWQQFSDSGLNLKPVPELETMLGAAGIKRDTWMIIYDDTTASWGAAGRLFWMLEYLGCPNVRILDGGWDKWAADGNETETAVQTRRAANFRAEVNESVVSDINHIADRMNDADFMIIDTRTDAEYIGWKLYGEKRGGHIRGAVHIPYESCFQADKTILEYAMMQNLFASKGVTPDKEVTAYCTAGIRSAYAYFVMRLMGYERASNYDASIWNWAADGSKPMDKLKNYKALVHPAWVDDLIKENNPDTYPGNGYVILFTSWEARYSENRTDYVGTPYETGHIPGAIFMDTYAIENGPNTEYGDGYLFPEEGNVKSIPELQALFGSMGISRDKTVVVYADDGISMMTAGRTAWALLLAGVEDVRILNGNYSAWTAYGGEIETTPKVLAPVDFGGGAGKRRYLAVTDDLHDVIDGTKTDAVIVDDREWAEFVGSSNSYYHYFSEYGRIPTAQWIGDWVELVSTTSDYLMENSEELMAAEGDEVSIDSQFFRAYTEVEKNWLAAGFSKDKTMIFYCGTGWRSAMYTFYAYLMGWPAANYDGSWFEWSYYDNPRETGNYEKLVDARWLKDMLDNNNEGKPYVLVETGWGPAGDAYDNGHIPEAIWVNTDEIEYDCFNARNDWPVDAGEPPCWDRSTTQEEDAAKGLWPDDALPRNWWNIYPDEYLLPAIAYMGIDKNTTVVVYGSVSAAARLLWTLMYAGVEDVRFLNGGKAAWTAAGYDLETIARIRRPVAAFDPDDPGRTTAMHPEYKSDIPFVRDVVNGVESDALIVDIRTWDEYTGATAPYSYIPTSGRVPGAVWGKAGTGTSGMQDYLNADGTLAPEKIYPYWNSIGLTTDRHLSFYCGTAWRSSLAWFFAYMIGYPEISNFDSSWFEWSMGEGSAYNGDSPVLNPIVDDYPDLPQTE
jgi:3-mercaptopyruvate sulfurtransferase SseA